MRAKQRKLKCFVQVVDNPLIMRLNQYRNLRDLVNQLSEQTGEPYMLHIERGAFQIRNKNTMELVQESPTINGLMCYAFGELLGVTMIADDTDSQDDNVILLGYNG